MNIEKVLASHTLMLSPALYELRSRILQKKYQGLGLLWNLRGLSDHCAYLLFDLQRGECPSLSTAG